VIDQLAPHGPTPCRHALQWEVDQAVRLTTTPARPREARVHRCVPVLWPDATTRWATADQSACGPREQARLVHLRGASRALRERMESSGESSDKAFTLNMHLAAALVGF